MKTEYTYIAIYNVGQYYSKPVRGVGGDNNLRDFRRFLKEKWNAGRDYNRFERGYCNNCEWSIKNTKTGEVFAI